MALARYPGSDALGGQVDLASSLVTGIRGVVLCVAYIGGHKYPFSTPYTLNPKLQTDGGLP